MEWADGLKQLCRGRLTNSSTMMQWGWDENEMRVKFNLLIAFDSILYPAKVKHIRKEVLKVIYFIILM